MKRETELTEIPEMNDDIKAHLERLGYYCVEELKNQNAVEMYKRECFIKNRRIDRFYYHAYQLAVYYANTDTPDSQKLTLSYWQNTDAII